MSPTVALGDINMILGTVICFQYLGTSAKYSPRIVY